MFILRHLIYIIPLFISSFPRPSHINISHCTYINKSHETKDDRQETRREPGVKDEENIKIVINTSKKNQKSKSSFVLSLESWVWVFWINELWCWRENVLKDSTENGYVFTGYQDGTATRRRTIEFDVPLVLLFFFLFASLLFCFISLLSFHFQAVWIRTETDTIGWFGQTKKRRIKKQTVRNCEMIKKKLHSILMKLKNVLFLSFWLRIIKFNQKNKKKHKFFGHTWSWLIVTCFWSLGVT